MLKEQLPIFAGVLPSDSYSKKRVKIVQFLRYATFFHIHTCRAFDPYLAAQ